MFDSVVTDFSSEDIVDAEDALSANAEKGLTRVSPFF